LSALTESTKFYTTNYDDLLERALRLKSRPVRVIAGERDMAGADGHVEVVKFHGDFDNPDLMVFSEAHYFRRLRLDSPIDLKLRSDLLNRVALFIGYSYSDLNVGFLFDVLNDMLKSLPGSDTGKR